MIVQLQTSHKPAMQLNLNPISMGRAAGGGEEERERERERIWLLPCATLSTLTGSNQNNEFEVQLISQ